MRCRLLGRERGRGRKRRRSCWVLRLHFRSVSLEVAAGSCTELIVSLEAFLDPNNSLKRKGEGLFGAQKKQNDGIGVIDLTGSDHDEANRTRNTLSAKDQGFGDGTGVFDLAASGCDTKRDTFSTQQSKTQGKEKNAAADVVMEGPSTHPKNKQAKGNAIIAKLERELVIARELTYNLQCEEEHEAEPWTQEEDEELARWRIGEYSDDQLDWPTFHESRTVEDLHKRLIWLEEKRPDIWAITKEIEEMDQERFERELSVEIAGMEAKG